jgi:dGTPase
VSKIARTIGRFLRLNEDLIEAISLGHDLGHVPYGHNGERKLDLILQEAGKGYFIHSAQSVRALMELENKGKGLNLTLQVLDGILCHNGEWMLREYKPQYDKTWDTFEREYNSCWTQKDFAKEVVPMTLEGCVVRISDVIAYIGRDFEDAIMLGLVKRNEMPARAKEIFGDNNRDIIDTIVLDLVEQSYAKDYLRLTDEVYEAIRLFYEFSKTGIYMNPRVCTEDTKIDAMFDALYETYLNDIVKDLKNTSISRHFIKSMPMEYRQRTPPERIVIDYLAGMTNKFFNNEFRQLVLPRNMGYKLKPSTDQPPAVVPMLS